MKNKFSPRYLNAKLQTMSVWVDVAVVFIVVVAFFFFALFESNSTSQSGLASNASPSQVVVGAVMGQAIQNIVTNTPNNPRHYVTLPRIIYTPRQDKLTEPTKSF